MKSDLQHTAGMKPHIVVSSQDLERLEALLDALPPTATGKEGLLEELGRAEVVDPDRMPAGVATMNSTVRFEIDPPREELCMTLVYPKDTPGPGRISVLTPVGTALLGLPVGGMIEWPRPDGQLLTVRLLEILYQPEQAGDAFR